MKSSFRRRVVHAALPAVALAAGWTASAGALPQPLLPTVTLPTVTLPTVTVPPLTTPVTTTPPVTTPATPPPAAPVPAPRVTVPSVQPPPPQPGSEPSGGTGQGRAETSREQASRLRLARDRRPSQSQKRTTVVIALSRSGVVELAVSEVAPNCRFVGRYRRHARRGVNRLGLRRLKPGTYLVVARSIPKRRVVGRTRLVVSGHTRASRETDSCEPGTIFALGAHTGKPPTTPAAHTTRDPKKAKRAEHHRSVLGARFGRRFLSNADDVPLWIYGLLALAVGLLAAAAALPKREPRGLSASLLIGSVGAAILLGLTIVFALG